MTRKEALENFLRNRGIVSIYDLCNRMGEGDVKKLGIDESNPLYYTLLENERKRHIGCFYGWARNGEREVKRDAVSYASEIAQCDFVDLDSVLYPQFYSKGRNSDKDSSTLVSECENSFEYANVLSKHNYFADNTLEIYKGIEIQSLQSKLACVPMVDIIFCIGDLVDFKCQNDSCVLTLNQDSKSFSNTAKLEFREPLKKLETRKVPISYFFRNVHEKDVTFGGTRVITKTGKLKMDYTPKIPKRVAEVRKYESVDAYHLNPDKYELIKIIKAGRAGNFVHKEPNPTVGAFYMIYWG